jgi:serine/threonine-protein kinase
MTEPSSANIAYWQRLHALLEEALTLPSEQRMQWLNTLTPEHGDLKLALGKMLASDGVETDTFLSTAMPLRHLALKQFEEHEDKPGDRVGPYLLLRCLGNGGMGAVWLAQRADGSLERQVALKLPHAHWAPDLAKRLRRERDILASLEHRNIARLYDAGVSEQGRPYLALEYVDGQPIDIYCNQKKLDVPGRVRLFLQVARAVSYAHARLIVHRDLKPTNVLVTAAGGTKLLDFGVAKLLEDESGDATQRTVLTQALGAPLTPSYASPEQIRGERITVASDVYSLGVVLYELLSGKRPYSLKNYSAATMQAAMAQGPIPLASSVASRESARVLKGDLDTIIAKALKHNPGYRYRNVDAFADDIERYLAGEPVLAQPDRMSYKLRKFIVRNRAAVAAVASVGVSLIVGGAVAAWQWTQAVEQRDRAQALLARNSAVIELNSVMLSDAVTSDLAARLAAVFAEGERLVPSVFKDQPERMAGALHSLADFYGTLPDVKKTLELLDRAAELVQSSKDTDLKMSIDCSRARWLAETGQREKAKGLFARMDVVQDFAAETRLDCLRHRGYIARGDLNRAPALDYAQRGVQTLAEMTNPSPLQRVSVVAELAAAFDVNGQRAEAEKNYLWALDQVQQLGLRDTVYARNLQNSLGLLNYRAGNFLQGIKYYDDVVQALRKKTANIEVPASILNGRAIGYEHLADYERALADYAEARMMAQRHNQLILVVYAGVGQASVYQRMGKPALAQQILDELPDASPTSVVTPMKIVTQARVNLDRGNTLEAKAALAKLVETLTAANNTNQPLVISLRILSELKLTAGDLAGARADIDRAMQVSAKQQAGKPHSAEMGLHLMQAARIAHAQGDFAGSQAALQAAAEHLQATLGAQHPAFVQVQSLRQVFVQR